MKMMAVMMMMMMMMMMTMTMTMMAVMITLVYAVLSHFATTTKSGFHRFPLSLLYQYC